MKKVLAYLLFTLIISSCGSNTNRSDNIETKKKWYEGGSLHKSKILEWKNATEENQLATCADFIAYVDKTCVYGCST